MGTSSIAWFAKRTFTGRPNMPASSRADCRRMLGRTYFIKNVRTSATVAAGFSSMIQWPNPGLPLLAR